MRSLFLVAFLINITIISAFKLQITKNTVLRTVGTELYASPTETEDKLYYETTGEVDDRCGPCPLAVKCKGDKYGTTAAGCDGTGKIQGGIATIPLFGWWPIKVFRPCPSYIAAGYVYKREGQTMDQVLFSEPSTKQKESMDAKRRAQAIASLEEEKQKLVEEGGVIDAKTRAAKKGTDLTEAEKYLEETFGN
mmetsp:Transcript_35591/g.33751  ORF Transcript_35591/g.33751 Transcript_35591/m.33751 type:complete len:193 (+) Transcript_35591:121-699(+)|eukprot:CAMPEP_0119033048 /NCGR_PEP_ID=MMETSP1177-20130426/43_1 /TAXON_ID=2985 /ORGANISM="Ochromonas sp, Strain CCMP1899" /LENGTH=192 /DNA_ID=CAMNT_0006989489 /DNA_START=81 /DNA_END=659 /DNA_ORIENTATION=-